MCAFFFFFVKPKISLQKLEGQISKKEQGLGQGEEGEEAKAGQVRISGTFCVFHSGGHKVKRKGCCSMCEGWFRTEPGVRLKYCVV